MLRRLVLLVLSAILILGASPLFGAPFVIGTAGNTGIGTYTMIGCPVGSSCAGALPNTNELPTYTPAIDALWLPNTAASSWIRPSATPINDVPGYYTFRTTFDLTGFDYTTAALALQTIADDEFISLKLNGATIAGYTYFGGFMTWHAAPVITTGFLQGTNTLDFEVRNANLGNTPIGLRVEVLRAEAELAPEVPEPASVGLMGLGLLGLGVLRMRRKRV